MSIRVAVHHATEYRFDRPVALSPHLIRLRPAPHCRTPIEAFSLKIEGGEHFINWQQDPFGNLVARVVFPEPLSRLSVAVEVIAPMTVINPFDFFVEPYAERFPFEYSAGLAKELAPYLELDEGGERLDAWLAEVAKEADSSVNFLVALNQRLSQDIAYLVRMEPGVQAAEETLEKGSGSCRDSAWLLVQIFRRLGLASRFVSGYLVQLVADLEALDGPSGTTHDFTDLHAWTEVFVPGAGWIGLDPTSGLLAGEGHIPLAATPEPSSAAPITGLSEPCEVEFDFAMRVERIEERPRVTKPFDEDQWQAVDQLGKRVDAALKAGDVRLTMGGEPTFVSIDDMDGDEWNTAALGPTKRRFSVSLLKRLRERFASGGLFHYQQGKWYPSEPLPRWALACYWRRDGVPVWRDPALLDDDAVERDYGPQQARQFADTLCEQLGIDAVHLIPAYEDVYYYLWRERTLPVDFDPRDVDLDDDAERRRLGQLLERGLGEVVGYALPLRAEGRGWRSGAWLLRRDHLLLVPGDSPMGLRLPLDALPLKSWEDPRQPVASFAPRGPLPDPHQEIVARLVALARGQQQPASDALRGEAGRHVTARAGAKGEGTDTGALLDAVQDLNRAAAESIPTSLCVEPRDGHLYVFLPPLESLEAYLGLIAAVERTCAELGMPVFVEGYPPPSDPRLAKFMITPDPGVIEVNIMPSASWPELVDTTTALFDEARQCRLGAEKFMLDGRHSGTGGGHHITLGGATPADSPFLRRPSLLSSMVTFWQHHPCLSYLFSGLFIGPTSQAPRVDEARHDSLYELEVALSQVPDDEVAQPWLVDRLFRHLLTDLTGNTHRAEFCIDKLYSPDSDTGRLGLLELRAFEMPPHPRMSLLQALLVRALVARFWREPYSAPLVRWGSALNDRWMLPHFLWNDLLEVLGDLRRHGFDFDPSWFESFLEFRFPLHGEFNTDTLSVELRQALEPWHVLGEEASSGGTARYVDSSVERLQVKVQGFVDGRYVLTCNGRRVPLAPTSRSGEAVAGVRYRAWQPPSALHPRIPVHAPLVFDLVDTWNQRSVGACTYHVVDPAGRNYERFPINANEAQARRLARFERQGHTQGKINVPAETPSLELPLTLDLRRGT